MRKQKQHNGSRQDFWAFESPKIYEKIAVFGFPCFIHSHKL